MIGTLIDRQLMSARVPSKCFSLLPMCARAAGFLNFNIKEVLSPHTNEEALPHEQTLRRLDDKMT